MYECKGGRVQACASDVFELGQYVWDDRTSPTMIKTKEGPKMTTILYTLPCFLLFSCFFLSLRISRTRSLVPRGFSFVAVLLHSSLPLAFTQPYLDFLICIRVALFLIACARAPLVKLGSFCCVFGSFSLSDMGLHASMCASPCSTLLPSGTHSPNPADCTVNLLGCGCFVIPRSDECVLPTHAGSFRFTLPLLLSSLIAPLLRPGWKLGTKRGAA